MLVTFALRVLTQIHLLAEKSRTPAPLLWRLTTKVRLYAARRQIEVTESLGSGKDGIVLAAKRKSAPGDVAIKAFRLPVAHILEKQAYEGLGEATVSTSGD